MTDQKLPWPERYRPSSIGALVGNEDAIQSFVNWMKSWNVGIPKKRAVLLVGPSGTGKTAVVGAIANDLGFELVEFNASDKRNKGSIEIQVSRSAMQHTLDGRPRVILLDEVDGLSGTSDRGGVSAILKIIGVSAHPIVMTANDYESPKLTDVMKRCHVFKFDFIDDESVTKILQRIANDNANQVSNEVLEKIVAGSRGDLRAAISDLEAIMEGQLDDDESLGRRDVRRNVTQTLRRLFMLTDPAAARMIVSEADVDHDSLLSWLEENIHLHLVSPSELEAGLDALSTADVYLGRIMRQQNWKLLSYVYDFLSSNITSSRSITRYRKVEYTQPVWPLLIWKGRKRKEKKGEVISVAAEVMGVSREKVYEKCIRTIEVIVDIAPNQREDFAVWLGVNKGALGQKDGRR
ncbi:MAG: replication factor C large subunit [Candidatus Thorarchaeota archaeon]|nr:replication factor C large subunit [Candidatus Thorarchaeota archaeon]